MNLILIAVISLGAIALVLAAILYVASKKFAVYEDPRIAQVGEVLPQANCGGCGYPGCSGFADACVKAGSLDGKFCPVGGQPVMAQIADILGLAATEAEPMVAVVRCNGSCANRPRINQYDGVKTCPFEAITLENNLAYIDPNKCKSCRKCVEVCPQNTIIELNFPPRKPKAEEASKPKTEETSKPVAAETPKTVATETPKVTE